MEKGKTKKCKICNKEFYVYPSRLGVNFCSRKCSNLRKRNAVIVSCKQCEKSFSRVPSMLKPIGINFCSHDCVNQSRKKEREGIEKVTPKSEIGRHGKRMKGGTWSTKKADLEFSRHIRARDAGMCYFCHKLQGNQASHFWGRAHSATRYDPLNTDAACGGCHMRNEGNKQGLYRTLKLAQLGEKGYQELENRMRSTMPRREAIIKFMEYLKNYAHPNL